LDFRKTISERFPAAFPSPSPPRDVAHGNGDSLLLSYQHDEPLPSGDAGVDKIALQHAAGSAQSRWRKVSMFSDYARRRSALPGPRIRYGLDEVGENNV
jgi:hypothetical protein